MDPGLWLFANNTELKLASDSIAFHLLLVNWAVLALKRSYTGQTEPRLE